MNRKGPAVSYKLKKGAHKNQEKESKLVALHLRRKMIVIQDILIQIHLLA
jgi:hypothetical protein